jgi:beta-glucosidase
VFNWGWYVGLEFYNKGCHVMLGPGLNVQRIPYDGRNFEYLSGEDPYLGYTLAKPVIQGIQRWVVANAKHYINNNQETNRTTISAEVDEQTQFMMYYPPFEGAIEAGVGSMMCSYNKINSMWSCEDKETLSTHLRGYLNFTQGFVMSDWGATHSTSVAAGLDQELPFPVHFRNAKLDQVREKEINQSVVNILTPFFAIGVIDHPNPNNITANVTSDLHNDLARQFCENSSVLLMNKQSVHARNDEDGDGDRSALALPIQPSAAGMLHVAVVGNLSWAPITHGTGSGSVAAAWTKPPLWSVCDRLGVQRISPGQGPQTACAKGKTVCVTYCSQSDKPSGDEGYTHALLFVGKVSGEGRDRTDLAFGDDGDDMVAQWGSQSQTLGAQGWNTVVVMSCPGAMLTPWSADVDAMLNVWMAGQAMGDCVANLLFGDVSPTGRLSMTFPNSENEQKMTLKQFPGVNNTSVYSEKRMFGYRWYDHHQVKAKFPFGFGLTYSSFEYGADLNIHGRRVSIKVSNSGTVKTEEVVQLYLKFPASCIKSAAAGTSPVKELRGFDKVLIAPGQTATVTFDLTDRDVSVWDVDAHAWQVCKGDLSIAVGSSVEHIHARGTISI